MKFLPNQIYHIANIGNNLEKIFYDEEDYSRFLSSARELLSPFCHFLAFNLYPNKFEFVILTKGKSIITPDHFDILKCSVPKFNNAIKILLSHHARFINTKYHRCGSLFKQGSTADNISKDKDIFSLISFFLNFHSSLEKKVKMPAFKWEFCSLQEYLNEKPDLCDPKLLKNFLGMEPKDIFYASGKPDLIAEIFSNGTKNSSNKEPSLLNISDNASFPWPGK